MFFRRSRARRSERANLYPYGLPLGMVAYAIGDVHGCLAELDRLLDRIAEDSRGRDGAVQIIFLGDLIDRGPDSAGVIRRLRNGPLPADKTHFVIGNHEEAMLAAWYGQSTDDGAWLSYGGRETLESYGISRGEQFRRGFSVYDSMRAKVPPEDIAFIESFADRLQLGDYLFAHAGIRPGVPLERQNPQDLRWIRTEFLECQDDHGVMVVHGHTIAADADVRHNRIGVDTGCYGSGRLTALGLSGNSAWLLDSGSQDAVPVASDGVWLPR